MVRREADGQTLYWIQDLQKMVVSPLENPQYGIVEETQGKQITAARINRRVYVNYTNWVKNIAQVSEDASRPYPPYLGDINDDGTPIPLDGANKPLMWQVLDPVMDEYGSVSAVVENWVPWVPPLPTIKLKK